MAIFKNEKVRNAFYIGTLCAIAYLAVYFARNILSAASPQMVSSGQFTNEYLGENSSLYFIMYAIGQLINGMIGDKIKARYMISFGLLLAGITNFAFPLLVNLPQLELISYGLCGFFLAMIYGPMTKVVAENTEPIYATRCSLGYTFSSFFGSPLAGVAASVMVWQSVFFTSSIVLVVMSAVCFGFFLYFEKRGIVKYNQYKPNKKESGGGIKLLIKNRIIIFTLISGLTGVIRTTVAFWLPTYFSQYLGYSDSESSMLFTVATFIISWNMFAAIFLYERLKNNMDLTIIICFIVSAISFGACYFVKDPHMLNIVFIILAIFAGDGAASMMWSRYCPSLRDTGMVSSATGFLDFVSYLASSVSSILFANAIDTIGWGSLILVWGGLSLCGFLLMLPYPKIIRKFKKS